MEEKRSLLLENVSEVSIPKKRISPAGGKSGRAAALHRNGDPEGSRKESTKSESKARVDL